MLLSRLVFLVAILCAPLAAQQPTQRDPRALALAARSIAAMGGLQAPSGYQDSEAVGTITLYASEPTQSPIIIRSKGLDKIRTEIQTKNGTSLLVVNAGVAAIQQPDGKVRKLQLYNTLAIRVSHIPALSLLAEFGKPEAEVRAWAGEFQKQAVDTVEINLTGPNPGPGISMRELTKTRFHLDRASGLVLGYEYDNRAENDSDAKTKIEVVFSDYRMVSGILVPFRQVTYADGRMIAEIVLRTVSFNVGLSDSLFTLPQ